MLISITPDDETRAFYIQNVLDTYNEATSDQRNRGESWYRTANQLAEMISGGNVKMGAGVIAALSANKRWSENTELAARAFLKGEASGHVGDAIRKATRIMAGESPTVVLPMSSKTGHFYRCIVDPTDATAVCVDRHAHDIAVSERYGNRDRGLSSKSRYALLVGIYQEAAERLGILPQTLQAVTWVVHIERTRPS